MSAVAEHTACGGVCIEKMCLGAVAHELPEHDGVAHVVEELLMDVRHGDLFAHRTCRAGKGCRWGTRFRRPVPTSDLVAPSREDGQGKKTASELPGVQGSGNEKGMLPGRTRHSARYGAGPRVQHELKNNRITWVTPFEWATNAYACFFTLIRPSKVCQRPPVALSDGMREVRGVTSWGGHRV